ncbi:MAG: hypothetical protein MHM6MM_004747 [Cercozoa sp. M6MM]
MSKSLPVRSLIELPDSVLSRLVDMLPHDELCVLAQTNSQLTKRCREAEARAWRQQRHEQQLTALRDRSGGAYRDALFRGEEEGAEEKYGEGFATGAQQGFVLGVEQGANALFRALDLTPVDIEVAVSDTGAASRGQLTQHIVRQLCDA